MDNNFATDVFQICRTCMKEITSASAFYYLDYTPAGNAQLTIRQKLHRCIPELDLSMLSNAVICNKCADTIISFYKFKEKCLQSEVQIKKYTQQIQHTSDLYLEVVQFDQPHNNDLDIKVEMEDTDITEDFQNEDLVCDSAFNETIERTESMDPKCLSTLETIDIQSVLFNTDDGYNIGYSLSPAEENSEMYNSNIAQNCLPTVMEPQQNNSQNLNKTSIYYQCYRCGHQAESKLKLIWHLKRHTSKHCHQKEIKLKQHVQIHTQQKQFSCSICEYRCKKIGSLKQHLPIHTGEKPFSCSICNYQCRQKGQLKQHMRTHTGEKPFSCYFCEYQCTQKSHLDQHMRIHTGDKPFVCSICKYKFIQKCHLIQHMRKHTGEKAFSCPLCEYQCNKKSLLQQHIRIHTGEKPSEKPFSCSVCEFQCNLKGNLKRHMRIHTREKSFSCSVNQNSILSMKNGRGNLPVEDDVILPETGKP